MEIKEVPIDQVDNWEENPRNIKKRDFERLKQMIEKLGVYKPLICVVENGRYVTLGGNFRLRACRDLGHPTVGISIVKAPTEALKLEYALSDNDPVAEYDDQTLAELIYKAKDGIDTQLFKINIAPPISVESLLTQFGPKIATGEEDTVPEPAIEPISKVGELYELGPHRLLCGDATKPENYKALMAGQAADFIFTDPPYNVDYHPTEQDKFGPILGDNMGEEDFINFIIEATTRMKENIRPGGVFYICTVFPSYPVFIYAIKTTGLIFSHGIVWIKNTATMGWSDYRSKYELILKARKTKRKRAQPIIYGWRKGKHYFPDRKYDSDVWEFAKRSSQTMLHPTQKPLGLIQKAIRNSSRPGEAVLDPFAGSGSTIIAADREGRTAYAMDLDPAYIDVIIRRYAALGGLTEEEIRATRKTPLKKGKK
jgi:DNA modification methylase